MYAEGLNDDEDDADRGKDGHWNNISHTHIYGKHVPYDPKYCKLNKRNYRY